MSEHRPGETGSFRGRTALVTGAASGIGRAVALAFAAEGAVVTACDRDEDGLAACAAEAAANGDSLSVTTVDLLSAESITALVAGLDAPIDILANVAGLFDTFTPVDATDDDLWERLLAVNVTAPMRLIRAIIPQMLERESGTIVNVASVAGLCGAGGGAAYTSSKHALVGLTRHVAAMYGERGVRCNAICPAGVATNIGVNAPALPEPWVLERIQRISLPRVWRTAEPDEIAALATFLCTDAARNMNGSIVSTDSGWNAI